MRQVHPRIRARTAWQARSFTVQSGGSMSGQSASTLPAVCGAGAMLAIRHAAQETAERSCLAAAS